MTAMPIQAAPRPRWKSVPLRSQAQKAAAIAGGEGMQMVLSLSFCQSQPTVVYFSSDTAQVWKSTDGGTSWVAKHAGFPANGARSVFVDPANPDIVLAAATLGQDYNWGRKRKKSVQGIYLSEDGGNSWRKVYQAGFYKQQQTRANVFAADPASITAGRTRIFYAGSFNKGLLRSSDNGHSWKAVALQGKEINGLAFSPGGEVLYIAARDGLYGWQGKIEKIGKGLPTWPRAAAAGQDGIVYVAAGQRGVFVSNDYGQTFTQASAGLPRQATMTEVACSPANPDIVYASAAEGIFRGPYYSHDGARTWLPAENIRGDGLLADSNFFWFPSVIAPDPQKPLAALIGSCGRGMILKTDDGGREWSYSNRGFTGARMGAMCFLDPQSMVLGVYDHGLFLSEDDGQSFRAISRSFPTAQKSVRVCDGRGERIVSLIFSKKSGLYVAWSRDRGETWDFFPLASQDLPVAFCALHNNGRTLYAGDVVSNDFGAHWTRISRAVMAMDPADNDTVYSLEGLSDGRSVIMRSSDRGATWIELRPALPVRENQVSALAVTGDSRGIIAATLKGLWIWDGDRWQHPGPANGLATDRLGLDSIKVIQTDPQNSLHLVAGKWAPGRGQSNGVFETWDRGEHFSNITGRLGPELSVWGLGISPFSGDIFVGTSRGTYRLPGKDTIQ